MARRTGPRKVISVSYKDRELRVAALLKYKEGLKEVILRQLAVPKELLEPRGSSTNKATVGIDRKP